jgi:hypothetical protein
MHAFLVLFIFAYSNINRWWILYKEYEKYEKKNSKNIHNKAKIQKAAATSLEVYVGLRMRF